jgi:hypothetical protein
VSTQATETLDPRSRLSRPERIAVGNDVLVRNDVLARELGVAVKTLNKDDDKDAPSIEVGGVKYRPQRGYREFLEGQIKTKGQEPKRKRSRKR